MSVQMNIGKKESLIEKPKSKIIWVSLIVMVITGAANLVLYFGMGSIFAEVTRWPGAGIGQIVGANNGYIFFAAIIYSLLKKYAKNASNQFVIVSTVGLFLSFGMPIMAGLGNNPSNIPTPELITVVSLSLMHVVSYLVVVPTFLRYGNE